MFIQAWIKVAAVEGDVDHLTEIVVRAVKEKRFDGIRMLRDMQWRVVSGLAIAQRSLVEFCNEQAKRRHVPFVPSKATIFWYDPMIIRRVGRFLGIPAIGLGLLEEVRQRCASFLSVRVPVKPFVCMCVSRI